MVDKNEQTTGEQLLLIASFKAWPECFGNVPFESSAYAKDARQRAESWL